MSDYLGCIFSKVVSWDKGTRFGLDENEYKKEYQGVIISKYVDFQNHSYKTLHIQTESDTIITIWNSDKSGLYDYSIVTDSIIKLRKSFNVIIKKKMGETRMFNTYKELREN
jgi:hypothetical protein